MPGRRIRVRSSKFDGSPHMAYDAVLLEDAPSLLRLFVAAGTGIETYRGAGVIPVDFTALFPLDGRWFNCYLNHWTTQRWRIESYANVALPAEFDGETLRWVDLDLDVMIRSDGAVALADRDEFAKHRVRFGYPADVVARAEAAADALLRAARRRTFPFSRPPARLEGGSVEIVPLDDGWRSVAEPLWSERWGSTRVVSRGRLHDLPGLPGLVAIEHGELAGVVTYRVEGAACEIVSIDALREGGGAGTRLLEAAFEAARAAGCRRAWLVTTNDNAAALRFYQRRGMRLVALHRDAVTEARRLKPEIPATGSDGIAIRDELELEIDLVNRDPAS